MYFEVSSVIGYPAGVRRSAEKPHPLPSTTPQEKERPTWLQTLPGRKVYLPVTPVAKPRMTKRDKWKKRPPVLRYRSYADSLRETWGTAVFPAAGYWIIFYMPMPKSWTKKKKAEMVGKAHQQRPDKDNLEKAILDALCKEDSYVYDGRVSKYWSNDGYIEIYIDALRLAA